MFCWVLFWLLVWFSKSELTRVKKEGQKWLSFFVVVWLFGLVADMVKFRGFWGCFGGAAMRVRE